uniref:Uncharacterized protein n=1 Tax=Sphenodon punctatus TaxID=8508 RepID=A0A8D0GHK3_SPHPU
MQRASWTLAAPFKEQCHFRSPSNSIANNYTLTARNLKMQDLQKIVSPTKLRAALGSLTKLMPSYFRTTPSQLYSLHSDSLYTDRHSPELEVICYSDRQPLTPEEQLVVMLQHEEEIRNQEEPPSESDKERYCYYIHNGIRKDMLAPQDKEVMDTILKHIPSHFLTNPNLEVLLQSLTEEIQNDYHISLMKDIVDYVLMDPAERVRLYIRSTPRPFPQRVIRAPVPWHSDYQEMKSWNEGHLFTVNPMMRTLQQLWFTEFNDLRFVRTEEILSGDLPLLPDEFENLIRRHCVEAHDILQNKWIPMCVSLFIDQKENWLHLAPQNDYDSSHQLEEYFASVAILMSLQLREMVINSLEDLLTFFMIHKDGNDFGETYYEMQFFVPQILVIKLGVEEPKIVFDPLFKDCWDLIFRCLMEILRNSEGIPKVSQLFPDLKGENFTLRTVQPDEYLVSQYVNKIAEIFDHNTVGPQKYLNVYRKYSDLLNNNAEQDVTDFLKERHDLDEFPSSKEIASMHVTVPLAMFCLDALKLNEELCRQTQKLKDRLIEFEVDENRELNKRYTCVRMHGFH